MGSGFKDRIWKAPATSDPIEDPSKHSFISKDGALTISLSPSLAFGFRP